MSDNATLSVRHVRNVRIPMPDGVTLAADLYLPERAGKYPAIIEYTPYHKNNNAVYGPRASRYPYFASHGYVFVNVDIRGTGDSAGFNTSPTSPEEVRDGIEVIRWCSRQPWSDGGVGMIGISYTAGVCYDAVRQAPPELKAVILCQMCSDWYDGVLCPGGQPRPFIWENYAPLMAAYNFAPPHPETVGADWSRIWQERLDQSVPWGIPYFENQHDGPYWECRLLRGHAENIKAATFLIGGWCDWYPDDFLRVFAKLRCPKRAVMGPWTHNYPENAWPLPRINDRYECLRWFDKYLKGKETDPTRPVDHEPPVTLFVREFTRPEALRRQDNGYFLAEPHWPPPHVKAGTLFLSSTGQLSASADSVTIGSLELGYRPDAGIAAGRYVIGQMLPGWGMGDDQRLDEGMSLVYTSEPLADSTGTEMVGLPVARLWLSSTAPVAFLSVKLCDVSPDGSSVLVTKGVLNLVYRNSFAKAEPLAPGQIYEVELPLQAIAYYFRTGHRLRLMIAAADFQNAWPTPLPHTLTIHHGAVQPSQVSIPWTDPSAPQLPEPNFTPSDFPPLPPEQIPTPDYSITRDCIKNTVTVNIRTLSGIGVNLSSYTVSIDRPAETVVKSEFDYPLERPGMAILVHSQCVTRSDAQAFHHLTDVQITVNGMAHWQKSWTRTVARENC